MRVASDILFSCTAGLLVKGKYSPPTEEAKRFAMSF